MIPEEKMLRDMVATAITSCLRDIKPTAANRAAIRDRYEATVWLGSKAASMWFGWLDLDLVTVLHRIEWVRAAERDRNILEQMQREDDRKLRSTNTKIRRQQLHETIARRAQQLRVLRAGIERLAR